MKAVTVAIIAIGLCFAAICFAAIWSSPCFLCPDQLSKVDGVRVLVRADVRDGCLNNPDALKTEAELALRRSGIKFVDYDASHSLHMNVMGYETTDGCVATIAMRVYRYEWLADLTFGSVVAWYKLSILSGPKASFAQQLSERVDEMVTALGNEKEIPNWVPFSASGTG